ncbi:MULTISPECIES: hypothetical protein [Clostridium]|uniref:hypothetical protein n=1 Tax=Clostridium TaxID=1485 RepID=UPI00224E4337|nr:hypothetical protein [Clostridium sp. LQ25]MDU5723869.1 hypothetical protein [Clostridium butyricum]MDU5821734.1 hypothetical protein [Clostridium butyricum]UZT06109.1 hypothetical protein ONV75_16130 [Clostridium sp. LQ25]
MAGCNNISINGSAYITEENKKLIETETKYGEFKNVTDTLKSNKIIKKMQPEINLDCASINAFRTIEKNSIYITPEIIQTNGSIGIFTKENDCGWNLKKGQNIKFNFEKYKSQVVENQTAIIGYIKNGEMIKGEEFKNLYGEYNLTIDEMENITYKLDRAAKINVIISPYSDHVGRYNKTLSYKTYDDTYVTPSSDYYYAVITNYSSDNVTIKDFYMIF